MASVKKISKTACRVISKRKDGYAVIRASLGKEAVYMLLKVGAGSRKVSSRTVKWAKKGKIPLPTDEEDDYDTDVDSSDPDTAEPGANTLTLSEIRNEMLKQINQKRSAAGKSPLILSEDLNATAQEKSQDMYSLRDLSHYSPNLGYITDQLYKADIVISSGGENIARGAKTVSRAMKVWMDSLVHKANILGGAYTHVGIGYCHGYWTQQFATNPIKSCKVYCPYCGQEYLADATPRSFHSADHFGYETYIFFCSGCSHMIGVCPACNMAMMKPVGIDETGSITRKCPKCNHQESKICLEKCPSCGADMPGNTTVDSFWLEFRKGSHYQEIPEEFPLCNNCNHYVVITEATDDWYREAKRKLESMLADGEDVFDFITWTRYVDRETVQTGPNSWVTERDKVPMDTPRINSLKELVGQSRLKDQRDAS